MLEVKINDIKFKEIGKVLSYISLDPHPVKYLLVMGLVVYILMQSL